MRPVFYGIGNVLGQKRVENRSAQAAPGDAADGKEVRGEVRRQSLARMGDDPRFALIVRAILERGEHDRCPISGANAPTLSSNDEYGPRSTCHRGIGVLHCFMPSD